MRGHLTLPDGTMRFWSVESKGKLYLNLDKVSEVEAGVSHDDINRVLAFYFSAGFHRWPVIDRAMVEAVRLADRMYLPSYDRDTYHRYAVSGGQSALQFLQTVQDGRKRVLKGRMEDADDLGAKLIEAAYLDDGFVVNRHDAYLKAGEVPEELDVALFQELSLTSRQLFLMAIHDAQAQVDGCHFVLRFLRDHPAYGDSWQHRDTLIEHARDAGHRKLVKKLKKSAAARTHEKHLPLYLKPYLELAFLAFADCSSAEDLDRVVGDAHDEQFFGQGRTVEFLALVAQSPVAPASWHSALV